MSGIRVSLLDEDVTVKQLKIHFSKPGNGGGPIASIYYPLFNNDAVIRFKSDTTAEMVYTHHEDHGALGESVYVTVLPALQMYPKLTADVEPSVANLLQATDELREEILYEGDLELHTDGNGNITGVRGNWYQLEWAWYKIECFMEHQTRMHRRVARTNMVRQMSKEENPSVKSDSAHGGRSVKADEKELFRERKKPSNFRNGQETDRETAAHPEKQLSKVETRPSQPAHSGGDLDTDRSVIRQAPQPPQMEVESPGSVSAEGPDKGCFRSYREQKQYQSDSDSDDHLPQRSKIRRKGNERTRNQGNGKYGTKHVKEAHEREIDPAEAQPDSAVDLHGKAQSKGPPFLNMLSIINDNPDDVKCIEFQYGPLNVSVYMGLITLEETDVIVNAAMGNLSHYGGVARAIADAAGPKLTQECDEYVKTHGSVRTSSVMHTCAGGSLNQKVKHVIHAVGPVWGTRSDADRCLRDLTHTFLNSFLYGNDKLKIQSLAVPLISSGIFGCPLELCVKAFLSAIVLYPTCISSSANFLSEIHLVNNSEENTALTVLELRTLMQNGVEYLLSEARNLGIEHPV